MNNIYIENNVLNIDRLECCYSLESTSRRRIIQSLNYQLSKKNITLKEYEKCRRLISCKVA